MPESTFTLADDAATAAFAAQIAAKARPGDVVLLTGPLGAGKTAFARAFIRTRAQNPALEVPSPTFTLVQTYHLPDGAVWHYDLWRITSPAALEELAWDEAQDSIVLVEWPDRLGSLTPDEALRITISLIPTGREIMLQGAQRWFDAS